jgi:glycosyltransferase involved in cell wall biosynthesis
VLELTLSNDSPLVCICIPTYNAASTVRETLASILAQSYPNLVVHVSDNASSDDTVKVIESIADPLITIHRHDVNVGGEGNFNRCIQLAAGKYTAIFHADDLYEPDMVAKQVAFLEANPEAGAVFTEASVIDEDGRVTGSLSLPRSMVSADHLYDFKTLFKAVLQYSNFFVCPSVMARTGVYQRDIQSWRGEAFRTSADLDVWFRIARQHAIGILPERLMRYRISVHQHSEKLRTRTLRSDFFLVIDHYLAQKEAQEFLSPVDWLHFYRLERTDRIVRAVNLYLSGHEQEARVLCADIFSADAFRAAFADRRGTITLAVGLLLNFFMLLQLPSIGKPILLRLKRLARK